MAPAAAQDGVKIGVLTDMTGQFADNTGAGSVTAAQLAIEDFGGSVLGRKVELVSADHQNKPDIASARAREWFDQQGVDTITELVNSAVAIAVMKVAADKKRVAMVMGSGSTRITGEDCTPYSSQWAYNSYATANTAAKALIDAGKDSWFFITADYAYGQSTEQDASTIIKRLGGKVVGSVKHPLNAPDFASYLLAAQASGAKVVVLASAGADTVNAVKQAREFGLTGAVTFVSPSMVINEVHGLGLDAAQGMYLTEGFYWDANDATRAFAQRFLARANKMPNMAQAAMYAAVTHYLRAVQAAGTKDADAVMARMRATPVSDPLTANGRLRADGTMVHDMTLFQVKPPAQSQKPWDYMAARVTVPGDQAFAPLSASRCPLVKER